MNAAIKLIRNATGTAFLVPVALAGLCNSAHAVEIKMAVKVPRYSSAGWVMVVPSANTGGRVTWSSRYGCYITDRVSRGETMRAIFVPSTPAEQATSMWNIQLATLNSDRGEILSAFFDLPYSWQFTVPTNRRDDNVYLYIETVSGEFTQEIPIGSR